jgi:Flagellar basal body protein
LASRKSAWLAARQSAIAGNIANANTPGYKTKDVAPFQDVLAKTKLDLVSTNPAHQGGIGTALDTVEARGSDTANDFELTENGNSIGLEQEMAKAGEINRDFSLTTNLVKSFHSMLMAALKE